MGVTFFQIFTDHDSKDVSQHQRSTGTFRVLPFYLALLSSRLLLGVVYPMAHSILTYWTTGLTLSPQAFFSHIGIVLLNFSSMQVRSLSVAVHSLVLFFS